MSKRKRQREQKREVVRHKRKQLTALASLGLVIALGVGTVLGPWKTSLISRRFHALFLSPVPTPSVPISPSKEYIYVGGRLIATEEPGCLLGYSGTPFGGTAWPIPGIVQTENFDEGGEGVGYHDVDQAANGTYRPGASTSKTVATQRAGATSVRPGPASGCDTALT